METDTLAFLEAAMKKDTFNIPVTFDLDNIIGFGKLNTKYLMIAYEELEYFESDEITVLAKVISQKKSRAEVYDPLKDFIKISRAMRRHGNINSLPDELSKIYVNEPAVSIEILAIYQ